ncbi:hypothetical protein [Paraburkholderia sp.]|uniref:hypothetical protein n=1 Tax=Paraburkholderia sp. TaxID=1926495 RepID=UPI0025D1BF78|nr:hypothetical protein [Paraburkholderia sp.]
MSASLILSSEIIVHKEAAQDAWDLWKNGEIAGFHREAYRGESEPQRFLELIALPTVESLFSVLEGRQEFVRNMRNTLASDWHQQVLTLVNEVKPGEAPLPRAGKLQLRYIEVPLSVQDEYLAWRESTIFDVVRNAPQVSSFAAYHTLLSMQPGVMFLSAFEGDTVSYSKDVFETERYQEIVKQAGSRFIAGGENGLYTRVFVREES